MNQPLFYKIAKGGTTTFINAAHVVKIEIEAATLTGGTMDLVDGSQIELGANEADWIMRLMAIGSYEQLMALNAFKEKTG